MAAPSGDSTLIRLRTARQNEELVLEGAVPTTWARVREKIPGTFLAAEEIRGRKEPVELYTVEV